MNCENCNRKIENDELVYAVNGKVYCYGCAVEIGLDKSEEEIYGGDK